MTKTEKQITKLKTAKILAWTDLVKALKVLGYRKIEGDGSRPESVTSQHHIAPALDSTAVRKIPAEPTGAAKIFQFHCRTNILHSVFTLKSRIQARVKFENGNPSQIINLHKPHPDKELKAYAVRQVREKLIMWGML